MTLATSGVVASTYGATDGYQLPVFAVDAKGRITTAQSVSIPTATSSARGLASFNSSEFSVSAGGVVTLATIDGGEFV